MDRRAHEPPSQDERPVLLGRGDREGDGALSVDRAAAAFGAWLSDVPEDQREWAPDEAPCPALAGFLTTLGYYTGKIYPQPPKISRWKSLEILEALAYAAAWCVSRADPDPSANYHEWLAGMDLNNMHVDTAEWVIEHWREADLIAANMDTGEDVKGFEYHADTAGRMAAIVINRCAYPDVRDMIVDEFLGWAGEGQ